MCDNRNPAGFNYHRRSDCLRRKQADAKPTVDPERGTGRTSRSIELALCGMLRGQQVLLVMGNMDQVKHALYHAADWLHRNGWTEQKDIPLSVEKSNHLIRFGAGLLRIVPLEANIRGLRPALIVEDHYALDLKAERERKQRRIDAMGTIAALMREHGFTLAEQLNRRHTRESTITLTN